MGYLHSKTLFLTCQQPLVYLPDIGILTALKAPLEPLLVFVNSFFLNNNDYQLITKLLLCITFVAPEKLCVIFDNKDNTLCDMNKTLLLLLFFLVRQSTIQAQHPDTSRFETAYAEIADMLDGKSYEQLLAMGREQLNEEYFKQLDRKNEETKKILQKTGGIKL